MPEAVTTMAPANVGRVLVGAVLPQPLKQVAQGLGRLVAFFSGHQTGFCVQLQMRELGADRLRSRRKIGPQVDHTIDGHRVGYASDLDAALFLAVDFILYLGEGFVGDQHRPRLGFVLQRDGRFTAPPIMV